MKKIYLSFFVLLLTVCVSAQHSITKYEKRWAIIHPLVALKIKKQLPVAMQAYKNVERAKTLDTLAFGGKLDAFRHTYTMAFFARTLSVKKLRKLGLAHEKGNKLNFFKGKTEFAERADSLACVMDLRNNEIGFLIGVTYKTSNDMQLQEHVIDAIKNGMTFYLKRDEKFNYTTCQNISIDLKNYILKWYVPKCLIQTNE